MLTDLSIQLENPTTGFLNIYVLDKKYLDLFRNVTSFQLDLRSSITVTNEPGDLDTEILYGEYGVRRVRKFVWASLLLASNWLEVIPGYVNVILINFYWISSIVIRVYTRPLGIARCRSDTKSICPMLDGPTAIIIRTEFSFNRVRPTLMFLNEFQNSSRAP